jgi:hypothetical protein
LDLAVREAFHLSEFDYLSLINSTDWGCGTGFWWTMQIQDLLKSASLRNE